MMRFLEKAREYWVHDGSIRGIAILNRIRHFDNMLMIREKNDPTACDLTPRVWRAHIARRRSHFCVQRCDAAVQ